MFSLKYKLRRGRPADAHAAVKLFRCAMREHGLSATAEANAANARFGVSDEARDDFVAVCGGKVAGFVTMVRVCEGVGAVSRLFVARSHRERGVGTMLIKRAVETARRRGYERLRLETNEEFVGARKFYERRGWKQSPSDLAVGECPRPVYWLSLVDRREPAPALLAPSKLLGWVLSVLSKAVRHRKRLAASVDRARSEQQASPDRSF